VHTSPPTYVTLLFLVTFPISKTNTMTNLATHKGKVNDAKLETCVSSELDSRIGLKSNVWRVVLWAWVETLLFFFFFANEGGLVRKYASSGITAKHPVLGIFLRISIPNTPSPVFRYDSSLTCLNLLRGVPEVEIDQRAAHGHVYPTLFPYARGISCLFVLVSKSEDLVSNSLDCDDARSPDAHFLLGSMFEVVSRFEKAEEGRWVCENFEVVEDLRDAVVGEHS